MFVSTTLASSASLLVLFVLLGVGPLRKLLTFLVACSWVDTCVLCLRARPHPHQPRVTLPRSRCCPRVAIHGLRQHGWQPDADYRCARQTQCGLPELIVGRCCGSEALPPVTAVAGRYSQASGKQGVP